ncbi:hypothetical protein K469DRAFT_335528 [Zopfia rhizophila CBS 207.26]|uniref:Uncharacterized protein n=1 Tax=Zopfia rhizophila CBS 207.26 TaxID=1314779 RepID=A0A6A6DH95_9PEZI|nr:hypothetical protein K469DRAFT_335528 [Zopfia rhizophila CBS 207.26]
MSALISVFPMLHNPLAAQTESFNNLGARFRVRYYHHAKTGGCTTYRSLIVVGVTGETSLPRLFASGGTLQTTSPPKP